MKAVTLREFLTEDQIQKCLELYPDHDAILKEVIEPNMTEINRKMGQESDARYLAYMIVAVIYRAEKQKGAS